MAVTSRPEREPRKKGTSDLIPRIAVAIPAVAFVVLYFLAAAAYSECASSPGLRWLLRYQKERSDVATLS